MTAKMFAGLSAADGLHFHNSTVQGKIGVWLTIPGSATFAFWDVSGADSKMTAAQMLLKDHLKDAATRLHVPEAQIKTFLDDYVAKIVAANTPKPPKAPKVPAAAKGTGVIVPPPGTTVKPADAAREANLKVIRDAAAKRATTAVAAKKA